MLVKFNSRGNVAGKYYQAGAMVQLADKLAYTSQFRQLVRSGAVSVQPRDEATQKMQAQRDIHTHRKAQAKQKSDLEIKMKAHADVAVKKNAKADALAKAGDHASAQVMRDVSDAHKKAASDLKES